MGCPEESPPEEPVVVYPHLAVRADQKASILARLSDAPFDELYRRIVARADSDFRQPEEGIWDWKTYNKNACISQANAFLAWLHDDPSRADKPRQYFRDLATDYENHNSWDLNIRMPYMAVCGVHAWDFLMGSGFFPAEEAAVAQDKLVHIAQAHFDQYVMDSFYRYTALEVTQNNHPLRTASTLALTGIARSLMRRVQGTGWVGRSLSTITFSPTRVITFNPRAAYPRVRITISLVCRR